MKMMESLAAWETSKRKRRGGQLCQNCIYWEVWHSSEESQLVIDNARDLWSDVRGECHRNAPSALLGAISDIGKLLGEATWAINQIAKIEPDKFQDYSFSEKGMHFVYEWPLTDANSWCGEFKAGRQPPSADELEAIEQLDREDGG